MRRVSRAQTHTRRLRSDDFIESSQSHTHCFHYNTNVNMCAHRQSLMVWVFSLPRPCAHQIIIFVYIYFIVYGAYGYLDKVVRRVVKWHVGCRRATGETMRRGVDG